MGVQTFGGNLVRQFESELSGTKILSSGPYNFFFYETKHDEEVCIHGLRSFTLYVLYKPLEAKIIIQGIKECAQEDDCVQVEDCHASVTVCGGAVRFLIAGTIYSHTKLRAPFFEKWDVAYKVQKPWGYELWLNGQHPCYALKKIFIKAGTKSSLQYHNLKQETIMLFRGAAKLHYKNNPFIENESVTQTDTATVLLKSVSTVDIIPLTLHRFEAVTDILLFEVSTPHLDDIVRVQDDHKRVSGRLVHEHAQR